MVDLGGDLALEESFALRWGCHGLSSLFSPVFPIPKTFCLGIRSMRGIPYLGDKPIPLKIIMHLFVAG